MNTIKRSSRGTTKDNKGQANLKGVTNDEILTKKEGSNVKILNSNIRLFNDIQRIIWWIGWRQWFGWEEWSLSKWRDKVDIAGEMEGTTDEGG